MNQEENGENVARDEEAAGAAQGNAESETASAGLEGQAGGEIDNLPVESIGSYARVEELLTDEEKENTTERG
ncbi:MAG TPA: hypothetical protein VF604_00780 [Pyrinomonadaceae bacterium]|jgi:hypothetical protein